MNDADTDSGLKTLFHQADLADLGFSQKVLEKIEQKRLFRAILSQSMSLAVVEASLIGASLQSNLVSDPLSASAVFCLMVLVMIIWFGWGPEGPLVD